MILSEVIRRRILESLISYHYKEEVNGYRLLDLFLDRKMSKQVFEEIKSRLDFLTSIDYPDNDIQIDILVYSSPEMYVTDEPDNKSFEGNQFWLIIQNNNALSFMNRTKNNRPKHADYYLSYEFIKNLDKKTLTLHDLNPANQQKKVGARIMRQLERMPKINISSRNWYVDTDKELAYPEGSESDFISFDKLLDLAKTPDEFNKLEPLIQERYERRKVRLNERH